MGNQMGCMGPKKKRKGNNGKVNLGGMRKRGEWENELIEQQALAMALHQQHKAQLRFERSLSHRDPSIAPPRKSYSGKPSSGKLDEFKRSASTRARHIDDLLLEPRQLVNGSKVTHPSLSLCRAFSHSFSDFLTRMASIHTISHRFFSLFLSVRHSQTRILRNVGLPISPTHMASMLLLRHMAGVCKCLVVSFGRPSPPLLPCLPILVKL